MKIKAATLFVTLAILVVGTQAALAEGFPWRNHAPPFDALFENHIDTHQQSKIGGQGRLEGFFYIQFTGEIEQGYPVAMHASCDASPADCTVGWILDGIPMRAKLVENQPDHHPVWCIASADLPRQRGYSHFHWLGDPEHAGALSVGQEYDGYLLKLTARESFFFTHHGGFVVTPGIDSVTHANIVTECE